MPTQVFPANYQALSNIHEFITAEASRFGLSGRDLYAVELSVSEAASNIIDHAYSGQGSGIIEISTETRADAFAITFRDYGAPFDPALVASPDVSSPLDCRPERGLGVFLMRKMMDEVIFDFSVPGVNTLTMTKRKSAEP
jgi:serine/threonine-protein kinase RsbW